MTAAIIVIAQRKGGVGKTTLATHLAARRGSAAARPASVSRRSSAGMPRARSAGGPTRATSCWSTLPRAATATCGW